MLSQDRNPPDQFGIGNETDPHPSDALSICLTRQIGYIIKVSRPEMLPPTLAQVRQN